MITSLIYLVLFAKWMRLVIIYILSCIVIVMFFMAALLHSSDNRG